MFGQYRLVEKLGGAGMSAVYRALNTANLDQPCVVKQLPPHLAADPDYRRRFEREQRIVADLSSPYIVSSFDSGEIDGVLYLAMAFADGVDLRTVLAADPLPLDETVTLVKQVARALELAHARKVVHRDVKPGNILVWRAPLHCQLLDFGIARPDAEGMQLTETGEAVGTLNYMAPERFRASFDDPDGPGAPVDVYGLAAVAYECLTGRLAFGQPFPQIMAAHAAEARPQVSRTVEALAPLDVTIARGLAVDPARRPTPSEFAEQLADAARKVVPPTAPHPDTDPDTARLRPPVTPKARSERLGDYLTSRVNIAGMATMAGLAVAGGTLGVGVVAQAVAAVAGYGVGTVATWLAGTRDRDREGSPRRSGRLRGEPTSPPPPEE